MPHAHRLERGNFRGSLSRLASWLSRDTAAVDQATFDVLAVSPSREDHRFLRRLLSAWKWVVHPAHSYAEAAELLSRHSMPVVICECELPDGTWQDVLNLLNRLEQPALLIVTSAAADDFLWAEVLNLGGYDVLMKPFDPAEVMRVVHLAWLHWKNRRLRPAAVPEAPSGAKIE